MKEGFTNRRCPKCGGNIFLFRDYSNWYEQCLQCSRIWHLDSLIETHAKEEFLVTK